MEARLPTESDDVTRWIETAFQQLKEARSPKKSVSFLVAAFKRSQLLFTVHAGDCRAGVKHEAGPSWKTTVHSLATALQSVTEAELVAHPLRNQLTRVFNNKRYCEPEITELQCECVGGAILVTDGYWAGLPKEDQRINFTSGWQTDAVCDDDVSRLFIEWRSGEPAMRHESHNLYLRDG
jgi:serine/threonine protein phosphatase PrpC